MTQQFQPTSTETNRSKARTSAAMLGLAISVGATSLLLPRQGDNVMAAEPPAAADQKPEAGSQSYIVQSGDTLAGIASAHSISLSSLLELNGMEAGDLPQVGQTLQVPTHSAGKLEPSAIVAEHPSSDEGALASKPVSLEKVNPKPSISLLDNKGSFNRERDVAYLGEISEKEFGAASSEIPSLPDAVASSPADGQSIPVIDVSQGQSLAALDNADADTSETSILSVVTVTENPISEVRNEAITAIQNSSSAIEEDFAAEIPSPFQGDQSAELEAFDSGVRLAKVDTPPIAAPRQYQVRAGDTLGQVAQRYGVSLRSLVKANGLDNPHMIRAGQILVVPPIMGAEIAAYAASGAESIASTGSVVAMGDRPTITAGSIPATPQASGAKIATPPRADVSPAPQEFLSGRRTAPNPYIAGLQAEIRALQQKYDGRLSSVLRNGPAVLNSGGQSGVAPSQTAAVTSDTVTTLEDAGDLNVAGDRTVTESVSESVGALPPLHGEIGSEVSVNEPEQIALASPSLDDSNPAVRSLLGQTVGPSLPPLASADSYLPSSMRFNGYIWPTKGVFTSGYGWRWGRMHKGIDIAAPIGTPIVAAADGEVVFSGWNSGGYGNLVDIRHTDGSLTRYAHNSRNLVKRGQKVRQGQLIAEMGSTGRSTGPHLHFEIRQPGQGAINPKAVLPKGGLRAAR
ncbi:MAG: peptidoglycan DD-metalloendopeptidase family protein [Cyanobacteria bacterium P01_D01_bin.73]